MTRITAYMARRGDNAAFEPLHRLQIL